MYFIVTRCVQWDQGTALKAFCDVAVDQRLLIKGIRVIEGRAGVFVSMPRTQNKEQEWRDVVVPLTKETKLELMRVILEAFYNMHTQPSGKAQEVPHA